jgi:5-oxoprolinase (ATP-hydrolysing) subunit A
MSEKRIDLNCDLGEGSASDDAIMAHISSANIACGFHAGDPVLIRHTIRLALRHGVAIGAHPSFPDRENFGRTNINLPLEDVHALMVYQIGALKALTEAEGGMLRHVKPHGALYNLAAKDAGLAEAIVAAISRVDPKLILYGLAGSELIQAAARLGLTAAAEVFVDRTYQSDGSLTPRNHPEAFVSSPAEAAARALRVVQQHQMPTLNGADLSLTAQTICLHGDGPLALSFAEVIARELKHHHILVGPPA